MPDKDPHFSLPPSVSPPPRADKNKERCPNERDKAAAAVRETDWSRASAVPEERLLPPVSGGGRPGRREDDSAIERAGVAAVAVSYRDRMREEMTTRMRIIMTNSS